MFCQVNPGFLDQFPDKCTLHSSHCSVSLCKPVPGHTPSSHPALPQWRLSGKRLQEGETGLSSATGLATTCALCEHHEVLGPDCHSWQLAQPPLLTLAEDNQDVFLAMAAQSKLSPAGTPALSPTWVPSARVPEGTGWPSKDNLFQQQWQEQNRKISGNKMFAHISTISLNLY